MKAELEGRLGEPIARLANTAVRLESLQRKGESMLPSADAAAFSSALQPLIEAADRAREFLMKASGQVGELRLVREEDFDERY